MTGQEIFTTLTEARVLINGEIKKISITCAERDRNMKVRSQYCYEQEVVTGGMGFVKKLWGKKVNDIMGFLDGDVNL